MHALKLIAITPGEPAGIGPDITLMLAQQVLPAIPVAVADPELLRQRAETVAATCFGIGIKSKKS